MPLSLVDANMHSAHKKDAVIEQRFWFRKHMIPNCCVDPTGSGTGAASASSTDNSTEEIKADGSGSEPGLNVSHDPCPGAAAEQGDREALDHVHGDEDIDDSVELMTMVAAFPSPMHRLGERGLPGCQGGLAHPLSYP